MQHREEAISVVSMLCRPASACARSPGRSLFQCGLLCTIQLCHLLAIMMLCIASTSRDLCNGGFWKASCACCGLSPGGHSKSALAGTTSVTIFQCVCKRGQQVFLVFSHNRLRFRLDFWVTGSLLRPFFFVVHPILLRWSFEEASANSGSPIVAKLPCRAVSCEH